jgi:hypothetical protein
MFRKKLVHLKFGFRPSPELTGKLFALLEHARAAQERKGSKKAVPNF